MDTSEEYIKMCDCPEIQGGWGVHYGDWIGLWVYSRGKKYIANTHIIMDNYPSLIRTLNGIELTKSECLWLPRQDQIQEMLLKYWGLHSLVKHFCEFEQRMRGHRDVGSPSKTMEQLWLAFYVYEKYEKIWNGKEWEKKA